MKSAQMHEAREECGVLGIYHPSQNVTESLLFGLMALQHRGQEAAGLAVVDSEGYMKVVKVQGLVGEAFTPKDLSTLQGYVGIGHVRYSTVGDSTLDDAQPLYQKEFKKGFAVAHNGNLVNYRDLRLHLQATGAELKSRNDAEILLNILIDGWKRTDDIFESLAYMDRMVEGAYSVVCVTGEGDLLAFRDPHGFRPLCYGAKEDGFIFSSESVAIDMCGGELIGDVEPGQAILISKSGVEKRYFSQSRHPAHCMFEYVYFSRPDSIINQKSLYDVRVKLGQNLAKTICNGYEVIIPVPDTSRPAAEGASRMTGIPVAEGLIKNRYVHRTFIMPDQLKRESAVRAKLHALKSVLQGRRIFLIDDSIVRGTTLKGIVALMKKAGAKEVHVGITCPPIISPCFYGIDIATHQELIAEKNSVDKIRELIGADSLQYQTIEGLVEAIGDAKSLCTSCLTGKYPTPKAQVLSDTMKEAFATTHQRVRYVEVGC